MNNSDIKTFISKLTGKDYIIATNKYFKKIAGDYNSANFLSQLIYWQDRSDNEWIFKSASDWYDELFLSEREVRTCKEKLTKAAIINTKVMHDFNGTPKTHYQVNFEKLKELLLSIVENDKSTCRNRQIETSKETSPLVANAKSSYNIDYQHRLQTETTIDEQPPLNLLEARLEQAKKKYTGLIKQTFINEYMKSKAVKYYLTAEDKKSISFAIRVALEENYLQDLIKNLSDYTRHYLCSNKAYLKDRKYPLAIFIKNWTEYREIQKDVDYSKPKNREHLRHDPGHFANWQIPEANIIGAKK